MSYLINWIVNEIFDKFEKICWDSNTSPQNCLDEAYPLDRKSYISTNWIDFIVIFLLLRWHNDKNFKEVSEVTERKSAGCAGEGKQSKGNLRHENRTAYSADCNLWRNHENRCERKGEGGRGGGVGGRVQASFQFLVPPETSYRLSLPTKLDKFESVIYIHV